jgi:hypothetical protein
MWRVLAYTLAIAVAFVGLRRLDVAVMLMLPQAVASPEGDSVAGLKRDAAQVAQASQAALQQSPRAHRQAAFRLGYELGYASESLGFLALSRVEAKTQANALAELHLTVARGLANQLGVGEVGVLPIATANDFVALTPRIEADENGLADRIERRLSLHHRHLYLLGMHVGKEAASIEMTHGTVASPDESLIRHHATVTGIPPSLWEPLALVADSETPPQIVARYRRAFTALDASLGVD